MMLIPSFPYTIRLGDRLLSLDSPKVAGIVNVTPDSFYPGSRCRSGEDLLDKVGRMRDEGADLIDVGACSTRPGGELTTEEEELTRLLPAVAAIRRAYPDLPVSVDTFRARVAERAVSEQGAQMINDVSGGDTDMYRVVARRQVPYVLGHPGDRTDFGTACAPLPEGITPGSLEAVRYELARRLELLRREGVNDVVIDPGFGFGKTEEENYRLLRRLPDLALLGVPVMVGVSRKSMLCRVLGVGPEDALNASTAAHTLALLGGASLLRVHDVKPAVECVKLINRYKSVEV